MTTLIRTLFLCAAAIAASGAFAAASPAPGDGASEQAGPGARHALIAGIAAAAVLPGAAGWGIFRYSVRQPIGRGR